MANAFHAIVPQSGVSRSSSKKPCYDVFINHRGKDVKRIFASTIYNMLDLMGVRVFLDQEELEVGESFPEAIEEAMRSASVHVAIFSPNYAESPWCLEELSLMLQLDVTIIPVFYHVQPNDLRYVTQGIFADAFRQHGGKRKYNSEEPRYTPQIINKWEEGLNRVSYLSGFVMDADRDEGRLLRKIVADALSKIKKMPFSVATCPVGLDEAVQRFESKVGSVVESKNVHIVGILGMGGSGKTTLAKELYNRKRPYMDRCSFIFNVRDASKTKTLHKLQEKLLDDLHIQHPTLYNEEEGKAIVARDLSSIVGLIVLDDVDHQDQLYALIPPNLGSGSFIIITTREEKVLKYWGISSNSIYRMQLLNHFNSKKLFCRHAFHQPNSQLECEHLIENFLSYQDLIERFVDACNGLPLSLKVLGAMVNTESRTYWADQLQKMSRLLPEEITNCLKLSYDALDSQVQQMFLDVSCLFVGQLKSQVVEIWYGLGWSAELGWETLLNKCLFGLDEYNRIEMHDHLRDMGRGIARHVSFPARIWEEEQIKDGRTSIRGIVADSFSQEHRTDFIKRRALAELKLLSVSGNYFTERFKVSRHLVWLRLRNFDGGSLPQWLSLANLRVLELYNAEHLENLWHKNVEPPLQLRELIIEFKNNRSFRGLPRSIGRLEHLKKIHISGAYGVKILHREFCDLKSLEDLQLEEFPCLSSLPVDFGRLTNLRSLRFFGTALEELPHSFKQLTALQSLSIEYSDRFMFTSERLDVLECMTQLQLLSFQGCSKLEKLPHLTTLVSLRELSLFFNGLRELPNNMCQLTNLKTLDIVGNNFTEVPESLGALSSLTSLTIASWEMLESLPEALGRLSNLEDLHVRSIQAVEIGWGIGSPSGCNLKSLNSLTLHITGVDKISILDDCCPSLECLCLWSNSNLREIETLPGNVRAIHVNSCKALKSMRGIGGLLHLKELWIEGCPELEVVPFPSYMHSAGHYLCITDCPKVPNIYVEAERHFLVFES